MHMFDIQIDGQNAGTVSARSRSAARYQAFLDMDSSQHFGYMCKFISVRKRNSPPPNDGYDYVRKAYKIAPFKIGDRCRLKDEGSWTGREGVIVYPGTSTAHIHVFIDGEKHISHVHPFSVEIIS